MTDKCTLYFPSSLYERRWIAQGIADYQGICTISVQQETEGVRCTFSNSKGGLTLTALEFANYLLELANAGGTQCVL